MSWTFQAGDLDSDDVKALLALHVQSMNAASPPEFCHVLPGDGLRDPAITFWSLRENGKLLGIGALKEIESDHGEVKSMRTAPDAIGRGVGTAMLANIVEEARKRHYRRLSLETGSTPEFAAANRLYERDGFTVGPRFGDYPESAFTRFYTMEL
ncbi:GNAT family N-acetyltransferase [Sphingomonas piscis]|uniref:GNAT family N-acetyltransferase n=1 Tax=Sphingomonas piscis TaxID=2714943 RepID=A0A6G7YRW4_9SPHN|nr:GNAT family N-acetyltransferase [Sphingomonas piscis]QIK79471.1 GNAT family N-acetyltransferase [Sphingomonas piscis]